VIIALEAILCGGLGAVIRFAVDGLVQARRPGSFPLGTLVVNLTGCFLLGLVSRLGISTHAMTLLGTATLGSYTTFSTWMLETHRPAQDGDSSMALRNVVISFVLGLATVAVGRLIGGAL
jgi:fluoride exporter